MLWKLEVYQKTCMLVLIKQEAPSPEVFSVKRAMVKLDTSMNT